MNPHGRRSASWVDGQKLSIPIEVDGGISPANASDLIRDGAEILVVGAAIYAADDPLRVIRELKEIMAKEGRG